MGMGPTAVAPQGPHAADGERVDSVAAIGTMIKWILKAMKFAITMIALAPVFWQTIFAVVMISLVIALGVGILVLILKQNPRIPLLWHSEPVDSYTSSLCSDLFENMRLMAGLDTQSVDGTWLGSTQFASDYAAFTAALSKVVDSPTSGIMREYSGDPYGGDSAKALQSYFVFHDSIINWGCIAKSDLRNNMPEVNDGEGEPNRKPFLENVVRPMNELHAAAILLSKSLTNAGDLAKSVFGADDDADSAATVNAIKQLSPRRVRFATLVHEVRMMLDQRSDITTMYKTRRSKMPMAIWQVYYWPMAKQMIMVRIPSYWMKFPYRYVKMSDSLMNQWAGLGVKIMNIPCVLAFSDPEERSRKCSIAEIEDFTVRSWTAPPGAHDDEVREGFFGGIVKALGSVVKFITNLGQMAVQIGKLFANFPQDPVGTIIGVITIILGVIVGIILVIWWLLLTVTGTAFLCVFIWSGIVVIIGGILYTIFLVLLLTLMIIPYFLLWLIDMPTGGAVVAWMRCENTTRAWYSVPNWVHDNVFSRLGFACVRPCPARYKPTFTGCCCDKLPAYMPDFCPQQQAYRVYRQLTPIMSTAPEAFVNYVPTPGFKQLPIEAKRVRIGKSFGEKMKWYQKCYRVLEEFDYINRHLCDNVDRLGLSDKEVARMGAVCRECYCRHQPAARGESAVMIGAKQEGNYQSWAPGGGNKTSCARIDKVLRKAVAMSDALDPTSLANGPASNLLNRALIIAIITLAALLTLLSIAEVGNKLFK